jgi:hypothetical protein
MSTILRNTLRESRRIKVHWRFSACNGMVRCRALKAWQEVQSELEHQVEELGESRVDVWLRISYDEKRYPAWCVEGLVSLPDKPCSAREQFSDPLVALDRCIGRLSGQLSRLIESHALAVV